MKRKRRNSQNVEEEVIPKKDRRIPKQKRKIEISTPINYKSPTIVRNQNVIPIIKKKKRKKKKKSENDVKVKNNGKKEKSSELYILEKLKDMYF